MLNFEKSSKKDANNEEKLFQKINSNHLKEFFPAEVRTENPKILYPNGPTVKDITNDVIWRQGKTNMVQWLFDCSFVMHENHSSYNNLSLVSSVFVPYSSPAKVCCKKMTLKICIKTGRRLTL